MTDDAEASAPLPSPVATVIATEAPTTATVVNVTETVSELTRDIDIVQSAEAPAGGGYGASAATHSVASSHDAMGGDSVMATIETNDGSADGQSIRPSIATAG